MRLIFPSSSSMILFDVVLSLRVQSYNDSMFSGRPSTFVCGGPTQDSANGHRTHFTVHHRESSRQGRVG